MLPRVILHNSVSVDGRITGFDVDMGLHYELGSHWDIDVHLAGSDTILSGTEETIPEDDAAFAPPEEQADDTRPVLAIPDSRGRVRTWHALRRAGFWARFVALCSRTTPEEYLAYLRERHVDAIVAGDDHVDLRAALEELNVRYGAQTVLVDSGGTLHGVLLRAGLVDEISLLIHPCVVGGRAPKSLLDESHLAAGDRVIRLELDHVERVRDGKVWIRYSAREEAHGER